ncbi:hypothetical protein MTYP_00987 [Methylophilaceae bacterium]|nr:hypothetical protein MTYP_00987 [Methylophilaceae bacterium]
MSPVLLLPLLVIFSTTAHAQVFKCRNANHQVVYSDTPCGTGSVQIITDIMVNDPHTANADGKPPVMQQLDAAVKSAIAANDLTRAKALATTPEHKEWVAAAVKENAQLPGKSEAQLKMEKSSSAECKKAKRNLEAEANASFSNPDVLSARKSLMYTACGVVEPVILDQQPQSTILYGYPYRYRYNDYYRPHQHHPHRKPGHSGDKPKTSKFSDPARK